MNEDVIKAIWNRRNKIPPFADNRKIALVLNGGIMSAVVGTGATSALEELGLTDAFDYVFAFSAGFPNASYFLAHQASLSSSVYTEDLSGLSFINFWKLWNIANIKYLIHVLKDKKILDVEKIFKSKTKIILQIKNITKNKIELLEIDESLKDSYFELIKASIDMPILCPGAVVIHNMQYKDYDNGTEQDFLANVAKYQDITDLLVVYNYPNQKMPILIKRNVFEVVLPYAIHRIETRSRILKKASEDMKNLVKTIFLS